MSIQKKAILGELGVPKPGDCAYKLDVFNSKREYLRTEYFYFADQVGERVALLILNKYSVQTDGAQYVVVHEVENENV